MRASGLRLEGSVVNGFNVQCGSQSKRVIVHKWGLDRLWLSCLDWSDAAGMVTWCSYRTDGVVRQLENSFEEAPKCQRHVGCRVLWSADWAWLPLRPPIPYLNTSAVLVNVTGSSCGRTMFRERVSLRG